MGCILSSTKKSIPQNDNIHIKQTITPHHRSPPPTHDPLLEEETIVKEVLLSSEIPPPNKPKILDNVKGSNNNIEQKQKYHHDNVLKIAKIFNPTELSSLEPFGGSIRVGSDSKENRMRVGSDHQEALKERSSSFRVGLELPREVTRSVSNRVGSDPKGPTTAEVRQRSPGKCRNNSPTKRSVQSPGRVRPGTGKVSAGLLPRKENNGESSFRRSRSPVVMCRDNDGTRNSISRCPSGRKTGKSPGRVRSELGDRRRMAPLQNYGSYRENNKGSLTSGNNNESLENPLVSMECFIFL